MMMKVVQKCTDPLHWLEKCATFFVQRRPEVNQVYFTETSNNPIASSDNHNIHILVHTVFHQAPS